MKKRFLLFAALCFSISMLQGFCADSIEARYKDLVERKPFYKEAQAEHSKAESIDAPDKYRFSGFVKVREKFLLGVEDLSSNKSYLLGIGEEQDGIRVSEFNSTRNVITLTAKGQALVLNLKANDPTKGLVKSDNVPKRHLIRSVPKRAS